MSSGDNMRTASDLSLSDESAILSHGPGKESDRPGATRRRERGANPRRAVRPGRDSPPEPVRAGQGQGGNPRQAPPCEERTGRWLPVRSLGSRTPVTPRDGWGASGSEQKAEGSNGEPPKGDQAC